MFEIHRNNTKKKECISNQKIIESCKKKRMTSQFSVLTKLPVQAHVEIKFISLNRNGMRM